MRPRNIANRIKNGRDIMMLWAGTAYNFKSSDCMDWFGTQWYQWEGANPRQGSQCEKQAEKILRGHLCTTEHLFPNNQVLEDGAPCHSA